MLNLLHVLPPFEDEAKEWSTLLLRFRQALSTNMSLSPKVGQLKLDRVGYSSLAHPFTYGAIPQTWDLDNDPLDIMIVDITEPLVPGSVAEVRIIGAMKFVDAGEVDDKIIGSARR